MAVDLDISRSQRIELILQQVDALPTLSPVAMRLLKMSSADDVDMEQLIALVEADVALTSRLLSMCRRSDTGLGDQITTVSRAVVMLGYEAVRSALLSVHLYDMMSEEQRADDLAESDESAIGTIDRRELWRHSIAVACAAEMIASRMPEEHLTISPDEAFVCGLLHDLGKYALDAILPRSFARVARLADQGQANISEIERTIIGVDHHLAGKRLAEHWGLPPAFQDVIWLHGQRYTTLPDLPHRSVIAIVTVADAVARSLHLGWSGNFALEPDLERLFEENRISPEILHQIERDLIRRVAERASDLGLNDEDDVDLAFRCVATANRRLGAMNRQIHDRALDSERQGRVLAAISAFHLDGAQSRTLQNTFGRVAASAASVFGEGFFTLIHQAQSDLPWRICRCSSDGRALRNHLMPPPPVAGGDLARLADTAQLSAESVGLLPWLQDYLFEAADVRRVSLMPLVCKSDRPAALLHDREIDPKLLTSPALSALTSTWGAAIVAASRHEGMRRLGEQLAEANRTLTETQSRLTDAQSMARLGEMAAGAAHEMNNPLTVISGRSQLLAQKLHDKDTKAVARTIAKAAGQLSELISSLHFFASPPKPFKRTTDLPDLMSEIVRNARKERLSDEHGKPPVKLIVHGPLPPAHIDPKHISDATTELLQNAIEAEPRGIVELRVQTEAPDGRLVIEVKDDGCGMDEHTLAHACDPFFSHKEAGRQAGLGLARASRLVELHAGRIEFESDEGGGTTARIVIPDWRAPRAGPSEMAA